MEIIGESGKTSYICKVDHHELEKYLNLYYGNLKRLAIGSTIDLSKGYNFHKEIVDAMRKTQDFIEANKSIVKAIFNGIQVVSKSHDGDK